MSQSIITITDAFCSQATDKSRKEGQYQILEFGVAVNRKVGDKDVTVWFQIELWNGNRQSFLDRYSLDQIKGANISLTGRLDVETYVANDGSTRTKLVVKNPSIISFYPKSEELVEDEVLQPDPEAMTSEF